MLVDRMVSSSPTPGGSSTSTTATPPSTPRTARTGPPSANHVLAWQNSVLGTDPARPRPPERLRRPRPGRRHRLVARPRRRAVVHHAGADAARLPPPGRAERADHLDRPGQLGAVADRAHPA